jgi:hypothetical protein
MTQLLAAILLLVQAEAPRKGDLPLQVPQGWESKKQEGALVIAPKDLPEGKIYTVVIPEPTRTLGSLKDLLTAAKAALGEAGTFKPLRDPAASRNDAGWEYELLIGTLEKEGGKMLAQAVVLRKGEEEGMILLLSDSVETLEKYSDAFTAMVRSTGAPKSAPPAAPVAGATSFGHMRFTPPPGWKSVAYANGALLQPSNLPAHHLDITVMQAIDWSGTLDDALKRSWDDAAKQLVLERTLTVDGTPYMKRQSGTSFKGWEFMLADGTLRAPDSDYFVKLFLVKIKGRVERIVVLSKDRSHRGYDSCAQANFYLAIIQEFFFGVQFDDWTDPVLSIPTLKGGGIIGVWAGISMTTGRLGSGYAIFFSNGQAYYANQFPVPGLEGFNTRIDGEIRRDYWGTWTFKDGQGVLKMPSQEIPLRSVGEELGFTSHQTETKYVRLAPPDGARFDGSWGVPQDVLDRPQSGITFTPGGEFKDWGAVNCLNHGYPLTEDPGDGTYEVRNYTLLLHFKDGREYRIAFPGVEDVKGNLRPEKLTLSFNNNTLLGPWSTVSDLSSTPTLRINFADLASPWRYNPSGTCSRPYRSSDEVLDNTRHLGWSGAHGRCLGPVECN